MKKLVQRKQGQIHGEQVKMALAPCLLVAAWRLRRGNVFL